MMSNIVGPYNLPDSAVIGEIEDNEKISFPEETHIEAEDDKLNNNFDVE